MWLFKTKVGHDDRLNSLVKLYNMKNIKTALYKQWKDEIKLLKWERIKQ